MGYATLMVHLDLGRSNAKALGVARDVGAHFGAAIAGNAAAQPIQLLANDAYFGGELVREDNRWIEEQAAKAEAEFRDSLRDHPEPLHWELAISPLALSDRVAASMRDADLLVVGVDRDGEFSNSSRRADLEALILQAGRPVLAVPPGIGHFRFRAALMAWKQGREARRALADALPMLRRMERMVIASVCEPDDQLAARTELDQLVEWLGRHGVPAKARVAEAYGEEGERLLELAEEEGAELIVAGAYGHSRFREWVLGGVTRHLLRESRCCLLMSN